MCVCVCGAIKSSIKSKLMVLFSYLKFDLSFSIAMEIYVIVWLSLCHENANMLYNQAYPNLQTNENVWKLSSSTSRIYLLHTSMYYGLYKFFNVKNKHATR